MFFSVPHIYLTKYNFPKLWITSSPRSPAQKPVDIGFRLISIGISMGLVSRNISSRENFSMSIPAAPCLQSKISFWALIVSATPHLCFQSQSTESQTTQRNATHLTSIFGHLLQVSIGDKTRQDNRKSQTQSHGYEWSSLAPDSGNSWARPNKNGVSPHITRTGQVLSKFFTCGCGYWWRQNKRWRGRQ